LIIQREKAAARVNTHPLIRNEHLFLVAAPGGCRPPAGVSAVRPDGCRWRPGHPSVRFRR
jgi:hypothetical protein